MKREERAVETERERDRQTNRDRENGGEAREGGKEAGRQAQGCNLLYESDCGVLYPCSWL